MLSVLQISEELALAMSQQLSQDGFLDGQERLRSDPRRSGWRNSLKKLPGTSALPLEGDVSSLSEVMNVAWAVHELFRDEVDDVFDYFITANL